MNLESQYSYESKEKGINVEILLKFIRHGERDKVGNLMDLGREITKKRAVESLIRPYDFGAVKAIGSDAGPKSDLKIGRAAETAHMYATEIAGDITFNTRINNILSYETLINPAPYNHVEIYNSYLPENFDELKGEERVGAAKVAQQAVFNHLLSIKTPEAETFKREVAGAFAYVIEHYEQVAERLNSNSSALIPAGTHGGMMELLLQQALVRTDEEGKKITGFNHGEEIGGDFDPSEAFNVDIKTNGEGKLGPLRVTFDNPVRPRGEMHLDEGIVRQISAYYREIHKLD